MCHQVCPLTTGVVTQHYLLGDAERGVVFCNGVTLGFGACGLFFVLPVRSGTTDTVFQFRALNSEHWSWAGDSLGVIFGNGVFVL